MYLKYEATPKIKVKKVTSVVADPLVHDVERRHVLCAEPLLVVQPLLGQFRVKVPLLSAVQVYL